MNQARAGRLPQHHIRVGAHIRETLLHQLEFVETRELEINRLADERRIVRPIEDRFIQPQKLCSVRMGADRS